MKCPFELPVEKEVTHVTEAGVKYKVIAGTLVIAAFLSKSEADYIVQAVNSHEKLVNALQYVAKRENPDKEDELIREALEEAEKE